MLSILNSKSSIYKKQSLVLAKVLGLSLILIFIILTVQKVYSAIQVEQEKLYVLSEVIASNIAVSVVFDDRASAQETLNTLSFTQSKVKYAILINSEDELIAHFGTASVERSKGWDIIDKYQYVEINGEKVGELYIVVSIKGMWRTILLDLVLIAGIFMLVWSVAIALTRRLSRTIVEPINNLAETSRHIVKTGKYAQRTQKTSDDEVGELTDIFNNMLDIIEKRDSELRISAITFDTQEAIIVTDTDMNIIRVNPAYANITGYKAKDVIGEKPRFLIETAENNEVHEEIKMALTETGEWRGEMISSRKDGQNYHGDYMISSVKNERNITTHYVVKFTNISERIATAEKIRNLAFHDALTALPNRRLVVDRLDIALNKSVRNGEFGAIFYLDLDKFKILNDSQGHHYGDLLLIEVAQRLLRLMRAEDTVSRLAGDEFIVMIERLSNDELQAKTAAQKIGEKIVASLNRPYVLNDITYHSSASVGVTLFRGTEKDVDGLLIQADTAMYSAKSAGKNRLHFFEDNMVLEKKIKEENA